MVQKYQSGDPQLPPDDAQHTVDDQGYGGIYWDAEQVQERAENWGSNRGSYVAYRGAHQHGVPFNHPIGDYMPEIKGSANTADSEVDFDTETEVLVNPVPVIVVKTPMPLAVSRQIATNTFSFPDATTRVQIAGRRAERNKLTLVCTVAAGILFSSDKDSINLLGFLCPQNQLVAFECSEAVWAISPSGAATNALYVLEEFVIESGGDTT